MLAKSIKGKSTAEISAALSESMADGFKPTLAVVFLSVKLNIEAVTEIFAQHHINVFGATSCGEFVKGHQSKGEIVILLMDLSRDSYTILIEALGHRSIQAVARQVANAALSQFANPALIICSTGVTAAAELFDGTTFVHALSEAMGRDKIFFGGMAGDDMTLTGTYVFTENRVTNDGTVALVLDGHYRLEKVGNLEESHPK
jgi:hypothetical protein